MFASLNYTGASRTIYRLCQGFCSPCSKFERVKGLGRGRGGEWTVDKFCYFSVFTFLFPCHCQICWFSVLFSYNCLWNKDKCSKPLCDYEYWWKCFIVHNVLLYALAKFYLLSATFCSGNTTLYQTLTFVLTSLTFELPIWCPTAIR